MDSKAFAKTRSALIFAALIFAPLVPAGAQLSGQLGILDLTANGGINAVAGLPGPARVVNQVSAKTFCDSDPLVEYIPGVGGCP